MHARPYFILPLPRQTVKANNECEEKQNNNSSSSQSSKLPASNQPSSNYKCHRNAKQRKKQDTQMLQVYINKAPPFLHVAGTKQNAVAPCVQADHKQSIEPVRSINTSPKRQQQHSCRQPEMVEHISMLRKSQHTDNAMDARQSDRPLAHRLAVFASAEGQQRSYVVHVLHALQHRH